MYKIYQHFKGNYYCLLHIAKDSETLQELVVYQALYGEGQIWVRPYEMFFESVERDGIMKLRFTPITNITAEIQEKIEKYVKI